MLPEFQYASCSSLMRLDSAAASAANGGPFGFDAACFVKDVVTSSDTTNRGDNI